MENATADDDWWADAEEMDSLMPVSALQNLVDIPLSSESISSIGFLPPPPRPSAEILALDELGSEAFTSSCDLCSWAWSNPAFAIDPNRISPLAPVSYGELGWTLTLIIVALLSAVIGAIVTVTILHCRRMKGIQSSCCNSEDEDEGRTASSTPENQNPQNPFAGDNKTPPLPSSRRPRGGFWSRLFNRHPISSRGRCESSLQRRPPRRLCPPAPPTNENHYTVTGRSSVDTTSHAGEEALYAELERGADPAYQNTGYQNPELDPEAPPSAPSSAYYSDLSCGPDRMYEAVGEGMATWHTLDLDSYRHHDLIMTTSLVAKTVPSDYI